MGQAASHREQEEGRDGTDRERMSLRWNGTGREDQERREKERRWQKENDSFLFLRKSSSQSRAKAVVLGVGEMEHAVGRLVLLVELPDGLGGLDGDAILDVDENGGLSSPSRARRLELALEVLRQLRDGIVGREHELLLLQLGQRRVWAALQERRHPVWIPFQQHVKVDLRLFCCALPVRQCFALACARPMRTGPRARGKEEGRRRTDVVFHRCVLVVLCLR